MSYRWRSHNWISLQARSSIWFVLAPRGLRCRTRVCHPWEFRIRVKTQIIFRLHPSWYTRVYEIARIRTSSSLGGHRKGFKFQNSFRFYMYFSLFTLETCILCKLWKWHVDSIVSERWWRSWWHCQTWDVPRGQDQELHQSSSSDCGQGRLGLGGWPRVWLHLHHVTRPGQAQLLVASWPRGQAVGQDGGQSWLWSQTHGSPSSSWPRCCCLWTAESCPALQVRVNTIHKKGKSENISYF